MKKLKTLSITIIAVVLFHLMGYSQATRNVAGTIFSANLNQPIPGANITSKATGKAAVSDGGGNFTIRNLAVNDTLVISSIGRVKQEIPVSGIDRSLLEVFLEEATNYIGEVVVNTGYQSLPKERATGSFTHLDNALFNRSVSTDLISRLEGVTNGLGYELPANSKAAPSSTPNLRIRGLSTIRGEAEPLIVVDNFPYEGDINNINPNDVESITVLKDAAAASIWGARAGNGVIVITTKGGTVSQQPTISLNTNFTIAGRPDLYYQDFLLPPAELVELERELYSRGLYAKNDWTAFTPAIEILFARDEGNISEATANAQLEELKRYDIRDDAARYLYRESLSQQYAANVNGGTDRNRYYFSAGYDRNATNLIGNDNERITLTAKNDFRPIPKLTISTSLNYALSQAKNNGISLSDIAPVGMSDVYSYARLADEAGNALPIVRYNRFTYTDGAEEMGLLDWHYRPLDELRTNDNTSNSKEMRLNTALSYQLLHGLRASARYQYQSIDGSTRQYNAVESYFARHEINRFTQSDGSRPIPLGGILDRSTRMFSSHYGRFQLDYNGQWKEQHELTGLAGFEIRQERNVSGGVSRLYGYDDDVLAHATNLNFNVGFPLRPRLSGRIPYNNAPGTYTTDRFVSYYANMAYAYQSTYVLSASARWDASNIFGVDFNQKGVPLWSVGAAWNAHRASFFDVDWVNTAKLRVTYGSNGNAVRSLSSLPYIAYGSTNSMTDLPRATMQSMGNPDLSWEQVNTVNLGLDFSLFGGRLSGSMELYRKNSSNLIGEDIFDPTTGIFLVGVAYNLDNRRNYASLATKGVDIELNTVNIDRKIRWQTTLLFSNVRNTVTNYRNTREPIGTDFLGAVNNIPLIVGSPIDQLYALSWQGLDNTGSPMVMVNGELGTDYNTYFNNLTRDDVVKAGVSMPPYFGSVRNTFTWRSLSLSTNILWKAGHRIRRGGIVYGSLFSASRTTHIDYLRRWKEPGDELFTNVPSMPEVPNARRDQAYSLSEVTIERGDFIRLQDINLAYQLPQKYLGKSGLSEVKIYAYAKNLGLLWKYTDYDIEPDVRALYPQPLQVAFGIQFKL